MTRPTTTRSNLKNLSLGLLSLASSTSLVSAAGIFQIDMERTLTESSSGTGSITQAGWTSSAADNGGASSTLPTPAGLTVTAGGAGGFFQGRAGGTWGTVDVTDADWGDMVGDTVAARGGDGTVIISLTGLSQVSHTLTAWHNVSATDSASFSNGLYAITPSLTTGTLDGTPTAGAASNIQRGTSVTSDAFNNSVISFTPDSSGNATVVLTSASTSQFLTLSGIELTSVPEPSSTLLMSLAALGFVNRRRR